jgi:hypothetical protein
MDHADLASQIQSISLEDAVLDYMKLCDVPLVTLNERSLVGNRAGNYFFFIHRLATRTANGVSFPEWLKTDACEKPHYKRLIEKTLGDGRNLIQAKHKAFTLYSGCGTIKAFRPLHARKLFATYNPTTVLDFSAGWGGRCLGAMSLGIDYIGFDTNIDLKPAYDAMVALYPTKSKVAIHFQDSATVDYSKYKYDMVFTSPPYFKKTKPTERYAHMPEYKDRADFNARFLFPVVLSTYKHLQPGGVYCLNIPIDMYDDIVTVMPECTDKIPLACKSRSKDKSHLGGQYKEYIYVWRKPNNPLPC